MKVMSAHEAKSRFGELLDTVQRQPVVVTKNGRAVGVMISMEDAADTVLPEMLVDKEPDHDNWLLGKVSATMHSVDKRRDRKYFRLLPRKGRRSNGRVGRRSHRHSDHRVFPERIRKSNRVRGTRELVINKLPYIAFVRLHPDRILVLNIVHTAMKFPD